MICAVCRVFVFVAFLLLAALTFGFGLFTRHVGTIYPEQPLARTEAIVVLTGGPGRVETGLSLLAAGEGDSLFITGVHDKVTVPALIRMHEGKDGDGLSCCVTLGHEARNTRQNARETAAWVENHPVSALRIVTAAYHMPRALLEFRSALPHVQLLPHPVETSQPERNREEYHRLVLSEYAKTILTWLRIRVGSTS
ncbi:MAG: YdcF family protein [Alphaproteobacteria bacterium]|nr:YdcF family protein [Alphaproteobacteria bacterium]